MIQRKQSVFLLLAAILGVLVIVNYPMWPLFLLALVASSLSIYTIFISAVRFRLVSASLQPYCLCCGILPFCWSTS